MTRAIETPDARPVPGWGRLLFDTLWQSPLWAVPFALFFGTIFGASRRAYEVSYEISLVFAYMIRIALIAVRRVVIPLLKRRLAPGQRLPIIVEAPTYAVGSLTASYLAAWIVHRFIEPGFLGSPQAVAISGAYTLLFTATFAGISYAILFYRESVARAGAIESMRRELAEAELRALRAQVHPHFLFNTLNTIAALVRENPAEAEETITRLADVFRYALRASEHAHARLADEIEFVRSYLEIERTRFGPRLRVEERLDPALDKAFVPSLLLQPLVENAVRYAVSPRTEGGTITLGTRREDGSRLVIEVADDGPGMGAAAADSAGTGFGLHSVRTRLGAVGPPHSLDVDSAPGRGTCVRITLPLRFTDSDTPLPGDSR